MPARLSSLLVRDGLVGVKRMEKAFQRQVIYGGSLDTILLEMNLVPEERLTQYLALASGLPPAARDEGAAIDAAAVELLDRSLALQFRAIPLAIDGDAVRILVCAPLELGGLEDLADALDRPIQPLIAPEYRWHMVFASAYGLDPPARFSTLARTLDTDAASAPVGRAPTVIVDAPQKTLTPPAVSRKPTRPGIMAVSARAADVTHPIESTPRVEAESFPLPKVTFSTPASGAPSHVTEQPSSSKLSAARTAKRPPTAPISTSGRDTPMSIVSAREALAVAEDRDTVFLTLLRAVRSRARWAGLLTVQGGAAIGRVALAEPSLDTAAITT
ncbi:MAG TPA: hypothetical protein VK427_07525, partial [Kofleriaceae bacterium]|nr:hypothetical protein [Kofleriaceae bacterium]